MQLLIIDALNLIRRLHAVQAQRHQHEARALAATGAALTNAANRLLAQFKPSHVIAVFDGAPVGFRHHLYPEYKAGRKAMPESLQNSLGELQQLLWQQGIDALLSDTDEADDLIATLATTLSRHGKSSIIVSTDQGFCQLLSPHIRLWDHFNQRWLDDAFVQQRYGLGVEQLVDYWALTGVSGSQIKGVPGIGPKRAKTLLQQHNTLDKLLATAPRGKDENTVHAHQHHALLSRQLVKLVDDIELGFNLQDLRYPPPTKGS
ncbi:flap endonuclease Xni [Oceanisphaera sp. KMM 10153]|uniref:flap endonuclease Xni n=1 Tax=Oceanisphaera submarina TaxID=3390193 RepID=UPI00397617C1